ncbi:MAG: beta strand repeat-containing protein [Isosphaeraceae bacterium]
MLELLEPRQLLTAILVDSSSGGTGAGTLYAAIAESNANPPPSPSSPNTIVFSGPMDIVLQQALPAITEPVIIDGSSAGGSANTKNTSDNAVVAIQVDGSSLGGSPTPAEGLVIQAYDCTVDGLSLTGFSGAAIDLQAPVAPPPPTGAIGTTIWGDWIGVAPNGTADGNPGAGIVVADSNNVIGGTLPGGRDLIENNGEAGVILCGAGGTGNLVQGSFILNNGGDGVLALAGNNVIGQPVGVLTAGAGNVISGNGGNGVAIRGPAAQGNIVANDLIGITPDGSGTLANQGNGVLIEDAPGNIVGGAESNGMDVIGGNVGEGILIENDQGNPLPAVPPSVTRDMLGISTSLPASDATGNLVEGDHIGYNVTQSNVLVLLPNLDGVFVSSAQNTIGGTTAAARNVVIANARDGIAISAALLDSSNGPAAAVVNAAPNANVVDGNYIGTQGGADDYGNTLDGIFLDQASADTIGGTASGAGNVISGNNNGIVLYAPATALPPGGQNVIDGNMIGTMSDGTTPLPNAVAGIVINGVPSNTIGGTSSGAANEISGNSQGIRIVNAGATGNVVWGNDIGADLTGTVPVRNAGNGVYLSDCSGNSIGGLASGEGNTIAYNTGNGVEVADGGSNLTLHDAILSNAIFSNALAGIALVGSANQGVAPPLLDDVLPDTVLAATQIDGTFTGQSSSTYLLQFFSTPSSVPAGSVEGEKYLGSTTIKTDLNGNAIGPVEGSFSTDVGAVVTPGSWVSATATLVQVDPSSGQTFRDTSEFTPTPIAAINPFLVTSTADVTTTPLPGSLRYAVNFSDAHPSPSPSEPNTIAFDIPGGGLQTIALVATLTITQPVVIDGTTQPGSFTNNSSEDSPPDTPDDQETDVASILVQIDGSLVPGSQAIGLDVQAPGCTIDGLSLTGFSGAAIFLEAPASSGVGSTIRGNLIGVSQFNRRTYNPVNPSTNVAANGVGILIDGPNNLIGGASPPDRNIIQGNSGDGVIVYGSQGTGNAIESNFILDNGGDGVLLLSADNHVGMPGVAGLAGAGNLISGNQGDGVHILNALARGNSVVNNEIGTQVGLAGLLVPILGTAARANSGSGVRIENAAANTVGGLVAGAANVLAGNGLDGVTIEGSAGSTIPAIVTLPPSTSPLVGQARNVVEGNLIGVNYRNNLVEPIPNGRDGVDVASPGNTIGGTSAQARNVIAANQRDGVTISSDANLVAGNLIGTTTGSDQYGNTAFGILINQGAANTLGGTAAGAGNVVSGNGTGIAIEGLRAAANLVAGNLVGTTSDASAPLANSGDGVQINGAPDNTIGGITAAAANVIGGNTGNGLSLLGTSATGNLVEGNDIGTNASGSTQLGNTLAGVRVDGGASNNTIGGTGASAGNAIAENGAAGVNIRSGSGDSILSNSVWLNAGTGIVIASPAVDQSPPTITAAIPQPGGIQVEGTLSSAAGTTFLVQVFSSTAADAAGSFEGQTLIGSATVTTTAGAGLGQASFSLTIPGDFSIGSAITATATSLGSGDTSEFSSDALNAPLVEFAASSYLVSEPAGSATITVVRNSSVGSSTVVYTASAGTAVAGVDFTPVSSAVSFAAGQQTATFSVPLLDTQGRSGQFTINLALADPSGAGLGAPDAATLTITSLPGTLQLATSAATVPESSGGVTIVVDRVGGASGTVSVNYATSSLGAIPGVDYTTVAGTLTFGPGVTQASFTLPIITTSPNVNDASVQVDLSAPQGGAGIGAPSAEIVTIDRPLVVTGERMAASAGGIASVTLTFNKPLNPSQAQDLANFGYYAYWANPRGQFLGGGRTTALAAAAYDPGSLSVTLTPQGALRLNHLYRIAVNETARAVLSNGLSDALGGPLVGSYGTASSPYVLTFGAGRRVSYTDSRGHVATLHARHGGLITMFQAIDGVIEQVALIGGAPGRSRIIGSVSRGQGGHGRTALAAFSGTVGVPIHVGATPLVVRRPGWRRH